MEDFFRNMWMFELLELCKFTHFFTEASQKSPGAIAPGQKGLARMTGSELGSRFPLGLRQHHLGLDAGAGVNQVVAEEYLRL